MIANSNKICFIICTNDETYFNECLLYISQLQIPDGYEVDCISIKDAKSMAEGYNKAMEESDAKYKIYLHQDILIINRNFIFDMLEVFNGDNNIGMMGVVGNRRILPDGSVFDPTMRVGEIYFDQIYRVAYAMFEKASKPCEDVVAIDGLLMATQYDLPWREDLFKGWDFYDGSQSLEFIKAGYRVVVPYMDSPWCLHDNDNPNKDNYDKWKQVFEKEYKEIYYKWTDEYIESQEYEVTQIKGKKDTSKFTVLITMHHNQSEDNKRCIESILKHCNMNELDIVVIDNYSYASESEWVQSQDYLTYVHFGDGKVNYANMINKAVKALDIHNDFIILDSIFWAEDDFINKLKSVARSDKNIGTVSPVFLCDDYIYIFGNEEYNRVCTKKSHNAMVYDAMATQQYAIYIKWDLWEQINGFNSNILSPFYVMMDFQFKALKCGYRNVIAKGIFIGNDSTVFINAISEEIYTHDMGVMHNIWGMHYYNTCPNYMLVSLVKNIKSTTMKNILEIGCDCGANIMAIKNEYPRASFYGIELNENAASIAKSFANVICGNIETDGIAFDGVKFDVIIFGDVLEHLRDPEGVIKMCREHLSDNGRIISSLPNVQNIEVLEQLIYGRFTYTEIGLLDKTHIHLFTKYEILKMFENAGYTVEFIGFNKKQLTDAQEDMIDKLKRTFPDIEEQGLRAYQYLVSARKN